MFIEILFKMLLFKGGVLIYAEHCIYIYICIYIFIRGVNVNALTHAINLKSLTYTFFSTQTNCIIRFDPNFLPSSLRGSRLV